MAISDFCSAVWFSDTLIRFTWKSIVSRTDFHEWMSVCCFHRNYWNPIGDIFVVLGCVFVCVSACDFIVFFFMKCHKTNLSANHISRGLYIVSRSLSLCVWVSLFVHCLFCFVVVFVCYISSTRLPYKVSIAPDLRFFCLFKSYKIQMPSNIHPHE